MPSFDPLADEPAANDERDVVGDDADPALFYFSDDTYLFLRMRVDAEPTTGGGFRPFGWAAEIDTDGVLETYELLAEVDGIGSPESVALWRNTDPERPPLVVSEDDLSAAPRTPSRDLRRPALPGSPACSGNRSSTSRP